MDKKRRLRFILKWVLFFLVIYKTMIFIYCLEGPDIEVALANRNMADKGPDVPGVWLPLEGPMELLKGEDAQEYLIKLLGKDVISDEEYLTAAKVLIMAGDDEMVAAILNLCYQQCDVKVSVVGGLATTKVIYKKTEKMEKLKKYVGITLNSLIRDAAEYTPEQVWDMRRPLFTAIQYNQIFTVADSFDNLIISSSYRNIFDTNGTAVMNGNPPVSMARKSNRDLHISWYKYADSNIAMDFNGLKETHIIISNPTIGSTAKSRCINEGFDYIHSHLIKKRRIPGSIFDKGNEIRRNGIVMDLFQLIYVSAIKVDNGKQVELTFSIYPSYYSSESSMESTQQCIENFNENIGYKGRYYEYGKQLGWTGELSLDRLFNDYAEIAELIDELWRILPWDWDIKGITRN